VPKPKLYEELQFERRNTGMRCEIHLLFESRRRMFPTEWGYCGRKAKWWWESYALCDDHKYAVQEVLAESSKKALDA